VQYKQNIMRHILSKLILLTKYLCRWKPKTDASIQNILLSIEKSNGVITA